jgi:hypothetical protein
MFLLLTIPINAYDNINQNQILNPFWIGIHNLEDFHEFQFLNPALIKTGEGRVREIKDRSVTRLILWTEQLRNKIMEKTSNRELLRSQYRKTIPLYEYSIIELSPDAKYIAYTSRYNDSSLSIMSLPDKRLFRVNSRGKRVISDILWLGDSHSIALITRSERIGYSPRELLMAIAGHPVPHNTFYLEIYSSDGNLIKEMTILEDIKYGEGVLTK